MTTRKIVIDNYTHYFNFDIFREIFNNKIIKEKIAKNKLENDLANYVNKSKEAIHNWRFQKNGPSDLDTIKLIASYFKLSNYKLLLKESEGSNMPSDLTEIQIMSLKRIYDAIIDYLDMFDKTDGFNDYWFETDINPKERKGYLCDKAINEVEKVILVYKKEYILLRNTKVYNDIGNYIYNDLYDIFDGKLSYAYRFEAISSGNPTTSDDYYKALNKLNSIINLFSDSKTE